MSGVRHIQIAPEDSDQRLDRWFRSLFPGVPQSRLQKFLRKGEVRVDGRRARSSDRLEAGQVVRVPPLPTDAGLTPGTTAPRRKRKPTAGDASALSDMTLYEDADILAVNKPPGLPTQGGSGIRRSLDGMLEALTDNKGERPRLVHRLDKDTSGVLLLARHRKAAVWLARAFRARETEKIYWALVAGVPSPREGLIRMPLAKAADGDRERMAPDDEGRMAITEYVTVAHAGKRLAWLALRPVTGRTHQLRVHCAELGTPIVGDGKYGAGQSLLPGALSRKLHLHARRIRLRKPDGAVVEVEAPLPRHMNESWTTLGFEEADGARAFEEE